MWRKDSTGTESGEEGLTTPLPLSRPPTYPTTLRGCVSRPTEKENMQQEVKQEQYYLTPQSMGRRFAAEEMRDVPVLSHRPLRKEVVFPGATFPTSGLLEEVEGILTYVECVTVSLLQRSLPPVPPESIRSVPIASVSSRQMSNSGLHEGSTSSSLAISLHESAKSLLYWFAKLEYFSLSRGMMLEEVDHSVGESVAAGLAALDAVELRYGGHAVTDVREFFTGSRQTVDDCRRAVQAVGDAVARFRVLRCLVAAGDISRVTVLLAEHYQNSNTHSNNKNNNRNHSASNPLLHPHSPFLSWIEKRWLPAMAAWRALLDETKRRAVAEDDIFPALDWARQEALAQSDVISEILQPGGSISALLREQLEVPLAQLIESMKEKRKRIDTLRAAVATPELKTILECVCAVEKLAANDGLTKVADRELLEQGKQLIIRLQQVENVEASLKLATQAGDIVTLFNAIHQANDILLQLEIAGDLVKNAGVVSQCSVLLKEAKGTKDVPPSDYVVEHVDTNAIYVVHVPSQIWTSQTTAAYQAACKCFNSRVFQERVRLELERVLDVDSHALFNRTCGGIADDISNSSSSNPTRQFTRTRSQFPSFGATRVQELRTTLNRAKEVGLKGKVVQDGEAYLRTVDALKLKVHFEAQLRVLRVPEPETVTFETIYDKVHAICMQQTAVIPRQMEQRLRIRYRDRDGDSISLVTQDDWNVFLLEEAPGGLSGVKLELFCDFPPFPRAALVDTPPQSTISASGTVTTSATTREGMEDVEKDEAAGVVSTATDVAATIPSVNVGSTRAVGGTRSGVVLHSFLLDPLRKNVAATGERGNRTRPTRSQSAGFALRQAGLLPRHVTPRRTAVDDLFVKSSETRLLSEDLPSGRGRRARDLPAASVRVNRHAAEDPLGPTTPGRSVRTRVTSVKLHSQPSAKTKKFFPSSRDDNKKHQIPKLIDGTRTPTPVPTIPSTNSSLVSTPVTIPTTTTTTTTTTNTVAAAAAVVVVPCAAAPQLPTRVTSATPTPTSTPTPPPASSNHNHHRGGAADGTPALPVQGGEWVSLAATSALKTVELDKARSWNEDGDVNFDLQTVISTPSVVSRPGVAIKANSSNSNKTTTATTVQKKLEAHATTGVSRRPSNGFTVTPCGKTTARSVKVTPTESTTEANLTVVKGDTTVVASKREWSTDMFMLSDVCTVSSEQTSPPASVKSGGPKRKQATTTTSRDEGSSSDVIAITGTMCTPSSTNNSNSRRKMEVFQQLRKLREENQKALKAAIQQRRAGK